MRFSTFVPGGMCTLVLSSIVQAGPISPRCTATPSAGNTRDLFLREILSQSPDYGDFSECSSSRTDLKVGIIGAGAAGLYAAILLDSLGIDYDILEADERIGGRIFTYRFDEEAWQASKPGDPQYYDYYDVGAMRFPGMDWMDRVIGPENNSLVQYINAHLKPTDEPVKTIPYIFQTDNTFRLFNDKLVYNQATPSADTFEVLVSEGGTINNDTFAAMSPGTVFGTALNDLVQALTADFDTGFNKLMEYDQVSVRQYLLSQGYSPQQVDWLETINDATMHYDTMSLSQGVIEEWIFSDAPLDSWLAVDGGMDRITDGMVKIISKSVLTSRRVTAIKPTPDGSLTAVVNGTEERNYAHVINTVPLGAMQVMDMTELDLDYRKKLAIRKLSYDPAGKIGMKFKTRWWQDLPGPFQGGQSFSDLPIRRCVYPSYGINTTDAAGTMIASYTWGQDSNRLGSYFNSTEARAQIVETTLQNLARMNNVTYGFLADQYLDSHLWNWYDNEFSVGGFALFSPDQFSTMIPALLRPAQDGKLHFAGEALSSGHAWIIGAVNSAYRTVAEVLAVEKMDDKIADLVDMWGLVDEIDMGWYSSAFTEAR